MIKSTIKHENLRRIIEELDPDADDDEVLEKLLPELNHSCLICPVSIEDDEIHWICAENVQGKFAMLFTDMAEYRKTFPDFDFSPTDNVFIFYKLLFQCLNIDGFVFNPDSEGVILDECFFKDIDEFPQNYFSKENAYTSAELKSLRDSIDNNVLEKFIKNPKNIGKYEELFDIMSDSTLMTLMLSEENLTDLADDGIISMEEKNPLGFLYIDEIGGNYATVYTSESKMNNVKTELNKYSQIVNFAQMVFYVLNFDMDGIIINPGDENVMLTRGVLLEYYSVLEKSCNDSKLNSAISHMFVLENEVYV